ncbi:sigma 54 modulation/S30EA ribosomal C-terminal domain-containing protein [Nocardia sp. NBC_01503]|uniref:sigma 54 modulation/S30EA ribosomal C-terminal domain-containing protein n=1 Tax=Nocardia sp. NBC_01503 TaxID=2975997 RepID=UPI002E7B0B95|nr:sigma 54 modulation/S30EA ribosomal C-terminal domain-containing protein [Nocardia sp. NBC_01503]WTL30589.1 sigma 54 modulation/S30EA ribosomal C-terminal domain-containing protein [Nocardia sp. NBC_01503]
MSVHRTEVISPYCAQQAVEALMCVLRRYGFGGSVHLRLQRALGAVDRIVAQVNYRSPLVVLRIQLPIGGEDGVAAVADRLDCHIRRQLTGMPVRPWPDPLRPTMGLVSGPGSIVRRKRCRLMVATPQAAMAVMDAFDFDAHLFIDAETGQDAVVYWAGPRGARLARQSRMEPPSLSGSFTVNPIPALYLSERAAIERLCGYGLPFLFYTDVIERRGRLLYRRYAGELGLVQGECGGLTS